MPGAQTFSVQMQLILNRLHLELSKFQVQVRSQRRTPLCILRVFFSFFSRWMAELTPVLGGRLRVWRQTATLMAESMLRYSLASTRKAPPKVPRSLLRVHFLSPA